MSGPVLLICSGLLLIVAGWSDAAGNRESRKQLHEPSAGPGYGSAIDVWQRGATSAGRWEAVSAEGAGPLPRALNFPQDVPAAEIRPAALLPRDPARDIDAVVAGKTDGRLVVINREDYTVKSMTSSDSGASFTAETVIPTGPPTLEVH